MSEAISRENLETRQRRGALSATNGHAERCDGRWPEPSCATNTNLRTGIL